jgi:hypothetical protein
VKSNLFWKKYRKAAMLGYVWFFGAIIVSIPLYWISSILQQVVAGSGIVVGIYFFMKYRIIGCPFCGTTPISFANIFFPIVSKCRSCGKNVKGVG